MVLDYSNQILPRIRIASSDSNVGYASEEASSFNSLEFRKLKFFENVVGLLLNST